MICNYVILFNNVINILWSMLFPLQLCQYLSFTNVYYICKQNPEINRDDF